MRQLTPRQARFVEEYLVDMNAAAAARRAGYSRRSANTGAYRLMRRAHVVEAIERIKEARSGAVRITAEKVLQRLAAMAFADPRKLVDAAGEPLSLERLDDGTAAAIQSLDLVVKPLKAGEGRGEFHLKVRFHDQRQALADLTRHLGLFQEDDNKVAPAPRTLSHDERAKRIMAILEAAHARGSVR